MQALVVFESMFGNTEAIAAAVGAGIARWASVTVVGVADAPAAIPTDVELLVVGGPTHAFGLSRPASRASAVQQGAAPVTPVGHGLREWLGEVGVAGRPAVAAFDTRVRRVPGSAATAALRRLRRRGGRPVAPAVSFHVTGVAGPLIDGELDRARAWGTSLAAAATSHSARP